MKLDKEELKEIASQLTEIYTIQVVQERSDKLLNKEQLIEKLNTNRNDVDRLYIDQPDFPKDRPSPSGDWRFSDMLVDEYIRDKHTQK